MVTSLLKSLKIAVAERSLIVRVGALAALKRALEPGVSYLEIARPEDFNTRVASFLPNIIIVGPTFADGFFRVSDVAANKSLGLGSVRFVALLSNLVPTEALSGYDAQISIFDSEDVIRQVIVNLLADAEPPEESSAEGEPLSDREKQVVHGVVSGLTNKEIAAEMNISTFTVLTHRRNIARKLNIHSSVALAIYAISNKLVSVDELK